MDEREREPEEPPAPLRAADEPEPDWAERIRSLRKERGDRLKALLGDDVSDEEGTTGP